ncbi:hypothetical protein JNK62_04515 [bacterium]|nr:hypothetical protein [bacterium]
MDTIMLFAILAPDETPDEAVPLCVYSEVLWNWIPKERTLTWIPEIREFVRVASLRYPRGDYGPEAPLAEIEFFVTAAQIRELATIENWEIG